MLTVCAQHYYRAKRITEIGLCIGRSQSKVETKSNMRKFIDCDQSRMFLAEINREKKKKKNAIISTKNYLQNSQIFNINIKLPKFLSLICLFTRQGGVIPGPGICCVTLVPAWRFPSRKRWRAMPDRIRQLLAHSVKCSSSSFLCLPLFWQSRT